jgi:Family of unknown function (DUF6011)
MVRSSLFGVHSVMLSSVARVAESLPPLGLTVDQARKVIDRRESWDDETVREAESVAGVPAPVAPVVASDDLADSADRCPKCKGKGVFYGYSGRAVGDCFACNGSGKVLRAAPPAACDVSAIATAFASAVANGIKRPVLRLGSFQFSRAPDSGKNAGAIYVKSRDSGEYLGKVAGGEFHAVRSCDDPTRSEVLAVAANPHTAAKAFGAKWGICSCCGRELSNAESVRLGIGPICRDKFGW